MTPCLSLCGQENGRCKGCYRSVEEIKGWKEYTTRQRAKVWTRLLLTTFYPIKGFYYITVMGLAMCLIGFILACIGVGKIVRFAYRKLARRFGLE